MRQALNERSALIQQRANALLDAAIAHPEPWLRNIDRPHGPRDLSKWRGHLRTVVAYRDRYSIIDPSTAFGPSNKLRPQDGDSARARFAIRQLTDDVHTHQARDHARNTTRRQPDRPGRSI